MARPAENGKMPGGSPAGTRLGASGARGAAPDASGAHRACAKPHLTRGAAPDASAALRRKNHKPPTCAHRRPEHAFGSPQTIKGIRDDRRSALMRHCAGVWDTVPHTV